MKDYNRETWVSEDRLAVYIGVPVLLFAGLLLYVLHVASTIH